MSTTTDKSTNVRLFVTKNYNEFKLIRGNRGIDPRHVARLKRQIEQEGNLTSEFPVNVNEQMGVIDGQHRVAALKELGYPVYYTISEGAGLATVRKININRKNWNWKDYAESFAAEGNPHYQDLLHFAEAFPFGFRTLLGYTNGGSRIELSAYQDGDYKVLDKGLAFGLLTQLSEIKEALPFPAVTTPLSSAFYDIMTNPQYDHKRMLSKLTKYGTQLREWSKKKDWLRNLEDIYNINQTEDAKVRFF